MTLRADILDFDAEGVQCPAEWVERYIALDEIDSPRCAEATRAKSPLPD